MESIKLGNTEFSIEHLNTMTKEDFLATFTGVLSGYDINEACKVLKQHFKTKEATPSKSVKKK